MSETLDIEQLEGTCNELKFVRFQLGLEHFAFSVDSVTGIITWREVTPLPNVPDHLLGLGNLRGRTMPVTDLRVRLQVESSVPEKQGFIVVAESQQGQVGLLVDHVLEVLTVDETSIQRENLDIASDLQGVVVGIVNVNDVLVSILDTTCLVEVNS